MRGSAFIYVYLASKVVSSRVARLIHRYIVISAWLG